jgi:cytochrome c553
MHAATGSRSITALLKTGTSPRATVFGPMAEVVKESLQYLNDSDINAIAVYLKALPPTARRQRLNAMVPKR